MTSTKSPAAFIATARKAITEAANASAAAEAALVAAESLHAAASQDDGKIDPSELYRRSEESKHVVGTARIVANRAAAKLSELEENYHHELASLAPVMIESLQKAAHERRAALNEELSALQMFPNEDEAARENFISSCSGILDRARAEHQVRHNLKGLIEEGEASNLAAILEQAAALI